jgi:molybdenum cofactor synthesis domain-containing protein
MIRIGILAVTERGNMNGRLEGVRKVLDELLNRAPFSVVAFELVPDEPAQIKRILRLWTDRDRLEVVFTTGSIRLTPRDHTPEATRELLEKEAPGLAELIRRESFQQNPTAALSRGVAGLRGQSLIVNLPDSPQEVRQALSALLPLLPTAVEQATGRGVEF